MADHKITPEEFLKKLKAIKLKLYFRENDLHACHVEMDELLCKTLSSLGYDQGIEFFRMTPKWYS